MLKVLSFKQDFVEVIFNCERILRYVFVPKLCCWLNHGCWQVSPLCLQVHHHLSSTWYESAFALCRYKHFERWATANDFPVENIINDGTTTRETSLGAVADFSLALRNKNVCDDVVVVSCCKFLGG